MFKQANSEILDSKLIRHIWTAIRHMWRRVANWLDNAALQYFFQPTQPSKGEFTFIKGDVTPIFS